MASKNIPTYKITIDPEYAEDGQDLGIEQIAFTATPAIKVKGMAFSSQAKPLFFSDELKYRITAPALIPMEIYRFGRGVYRVFVGDGHCIPFRFVGAPIRADA